MMAGNVPLPDMHGSSVARLYVGGFPFSFLLPVQEALSGSRGMRPSR